MEFQLSRYSAKFPQIVFLVALLVRLVYLVESLDNPTAFFPIVDAERYESAAQTLAQGEAVADLFWQPIGYPLFLALIYKLVGPQILAARLLQALLGALTAALTCIVGRRLFSAKTGLLAGLIVALYGPLVFFELELLATGWAAFWAICLVLLFLKAEERPGLSNLLLVGLASALASLTRPTFLPFVLLAGAWWAVRQWRAGERRSAMRGVASATAGFLLAALPVATFCQSTTGRFTIFPSSAGVNLYIGNNPNWEQTLVVRPGYDWEKLLQMPVAGNSIDSWEASDFFTNRVVDYAVEQPLSFLAGLVAKTQRMLSSREIPRNVDIYVFHQWSNWLRLSTWKLSGFGFPFGLLLPLALIGLVAERKRTPYPVWILVTLVPAAVIGTFVSARYRVPIVPVLAVVAAAGAVFLWKALHDRRLRQVAALSALALAVALAGSVPTSFAEERLAFESELYGAIGLRLRDQDNQGSREAAIAALQRAISLTPDYAEALNELGILLEQEGRFEEAIGSYSRALEAAPHRADVPFNLGTALAGRGQLEPARDLLERSLRLDPKYVKPVLSLAWVHDAQGEVDTAIQLYRQALELDPGNPMAINNLAGVHARLDQWDEAIRLLETAVRRYPRDTKLKEHLEHLQAKKGIGTSDLHFCTCPP